MNQLIELIWSLIIYIAISLGRTHHSGAPSLQALVGGGRADGWIAAVAVAAGAAPGASVRATLSAAGRMSPAAVAAGARAAPADARAAPAALTAALRAARRCAVLTSSRACPGRIQPVPVRSSLSQYSGERPQCFHHTCPRQSQRPRAASCPRAADPSSHTAPQVVQVAQLCHARLSLGAAPATLQLLRAHTPRLRRAGCASHAAACSPTRTFHPRSPISVTAAHSPLSTLSGEYSVVFHSLPRQASLGSRPRALVRGRPSSILTRARSGTRRALTPNLQSRRPLEMEAIRKTVRPCQAVTAQRKLAL